MRNPRLLAALAMAMMSGAGIAQPQPHPQRHQPAPPRPRRILIRPALDREIAEHNEAVARRKAEKKARKLAR